MKRTVENVQLGAGEDFNFETKWDEFDESLSVYFNEDSANGNINFSVKQQP